MTLAMKCPELRMLWD